MLTNINDITVYSLNPDVYANRTYYIDYLRDLKIFKRVDRVSFNVKLQNRLRTIILAHLFALLRMYDRNDFPVLLLEDDARLMKDLPKSFNVPDEANIVYLGGSIYTPGVIDARYIKEYNKDFYRVYNMVCAHAILIMNKEGCKTIVDAYTEAIFKNIFNDVSLGITSHKEIFLTPKEGMYFYQEGVEGVTKFEWSKHPEMLKK